MAATQLSTGSADGTVLGQSSTDLIGFYGLSTPVAQLSSTAIVTISLTTISTADSGFMFLTSASFNQFVAQVAFCARVIKSLGLAGST
jgi:hypothetical protein